MARDRWAEKSATCIGLIASKARVAPFSEELSLPRLELSSGVIAKMCNTVKVALGRHVNLMIVING